MAIAATDREGGPVMGIFTNDELCGQIPARRTVPQLVHISPVVYGTRRFITVLSTARRHLFPVLGQKNPVHISTLCSFTIHFEITLPSASKSCQWFFSWAYPNKTLHVFLLPTPTTWHYHLNLLHLITGIISGDLNRSSSTYLAL